MTAIYKYILYEYIISEHDLRPDLITPPFSVGLVIALRLRLLRFVDVDRRSKSFTTMAPPLEIVYQLPALWIPIMAGSVMEAANMTF